MSATRSPFGARPIRLRSGAPYYGQINEYVVPESETGAMYIGDIAKWGPPTATEDGTRQWAVLATAGDTGQLGSVIGFLPTGDQSTIYRAGSTRRIALIADDQGVVFEVQVASQVTASMVGGNADFVSGIGGSAFTGLSGVQLATTPTNSATATFNAKVIGFSSKPTESATDLYPIVEIVFNHNEHHFTGIGAT